MNQRPGRADEPDGQRGTVEAFHYPGPQAHVLAFVAAYNLAGHLSALRRRTPFRAVRNAWEAELSAFKIDPHHLIPGPDT